MSLLANISLQDIIDMALERAPADVDKRVGSIIYDTVASAAVSILYLAMKANSIDELTFIHSTYGEYLDMRVAEKGITRNPATHAVKVATFTRQGEPLVGIPAGVRFSAVDNSNELTYTVEEPVEETPGNYLVRCEQAGTVGNLYYGPISPIDYVEEVSTAEIVSDHTEATDVESDDDLRARYLAEYKKSSFGGNVSQYHEMLTEIDGVGAVQIYRAKPIPGWITIAVLSSSYMPISSEFTRTLQEMVDPTQDGSGVGMAPIMHKVAIVAPQTWSVNISMQLLKESGYTTEQLRPLIVEALEDYFTQVRKKWGVLTPEHTYGVAVYSSQILRALLNIEGIVSVDNLLINGSNGSMFFAANSSGITPVPVLGEVTVNG